MPGGHSVRFLFPLLYWFGLILALLGVGLRFWLGSQHWGLVLAVVGVGLLLCARVAQAVRRGSRRTARGSSD